MKKKKKRKKNSENSKPWHDQDLDKLKRITIEKGKLMTKFPRDPIIRGSFFKINKQYSKLRKKKKKEFRQSVLDRLDALESENPKEYWSLLNSLKDEKKG